MRLNAFLAECGVASRRKSDELILNGQVRVNGKIVLASYFSVAEEDVVECGGKRLSPVKKIYLAMNKPPGVVCAVSDKYDPVVVDLLPAAMKAARVFPVGRLDRDSEGLLILTNDGAFAQSVQHPSKGVLKEYEALLNLEVNDRHLARWKAGFEIEGRLVKPHLAELIRRDPPGRWLRVVIGEGLKREIRTMARMTGFSVCRLIRSGIGRMKLEQLQKGQFVELSFQDMYTRIFTGGVV